MKYRTRWGVTRICMTPELEYQVVLQYDSGVTAVRGVFDTRYDAEEYLMKIARRNEHIIIREDFDIHSTPDVTVANTRTQELAVQREEQRKLKGESRNERFKSTRKTFDS